MLGLTVWSNVRSCNGCDLHVTIAKESLRSDPRILALRPADPEAGALGRIDVLKGDNPRFPTTHGKLVFIGDCTADLAAEHAGGVYCGMPA